MGMKTTAKRISVGERIVTTAGVREVLDITYKPTPMRAGYYTVLWVQDPSAVDGKTPINFHADSTVERVGVTAATLAKRATR